LVREINRCDRDDPKLVAGCRRSPASKAYQTLIKDKTTMNVALLRTPVALAIASLALFATATPALGAAFQLNESSASGLGKAFAGGAAAAEDASTVWANPAGMSRLRGSQAVGVIHLITPSMKLSDEGSVAASQQALGGTGGDAGGLNVVPNLYLVMPINAAWSAGIGVTAPWGLVTEYDGDWMGRFQAVKSSIKTINVNPALSWKPADGVALGLGLNVQRMEGEFTNHVNYSGALLSAAAKGGIAPGSATFNAIAAATPGLESGAQIKGSDNGTGWNVGVLWDLDQNSRLGIHYRSAIKFHLTGDATFTNPSLPPLPSALAPVVGALAGAVNTTALYDSGITSDVKMPEIVNLSYFRTVSGSWDVMADAQWTGWSSIQTLSFVRTDGKLLQSTPLNFKSGWKYAAGFNYRPGGEWTWRGGLAFDKSPVQDEFRTARLPDADRTWLTGGGQYKMSETFKFDFGAGYIWVKGATINNNNGDPTGQSYGVLKGQYDSNTVILSGQATWSF
jgi:long-chain fatty acid transport protein